MPNRRTVPLPKDAVLIELRPDFLSFGTREALLPGTVVAFNLVMEGHALPLSLEILRTELVEKDRGGYVFVSYVSLETMANTDRHLVEVFIKKGRGAPELRR
jgi:hypothetical protein